jgi:hypothetical protein
VPHKVCPNNFVEKLNGFLKLLDLHKITLPSRTIKKRGHPAFPSRQGRIFFVHGMLHKRAQPNGAAQGTDAAANKPENVKKQPKNGPKSTSISAPLQPQPSANQQVTGIGNL